MNLDMMTAVLVIPVLIAAAARDIMTSEIPRWTTVGVACIGVMRALFRIIAEKAAGEAALADVAGMIFRPVLGAAAVLILLLPVYYMTGRKKLGGGDIKLMVAAGILLGAWNAVLALMFACIYCCIYRVIRPARTARSGVFAFGPYLAAGIITMLIGMQKIS